jgi:hypothetical protein
MSGFRAGDSAFPFLLPVRTFLLGWSCMGLSELSIRRHHSLLHFLFDISLSKRDSLEYPLQPGTGQAGLTLL